MTAKVGVLDDYQGVAPRLADWTRLDGRAEVTFFRDHLADEDALVERLAPFDALCLMRERTPFPRTLIDRLPNLKLLVTSGMWNRSIDLDAARDRGIVVCGTQVGSNAMVTLTFGLIFALAHRIVIEDRVVRAGGWQEGIGHDLSGKTLGLIGLGRIGGDVARIAPHFGLRVVAWSQNMTPERAAEFGAEYVDKDELLRRSDIVSVQVVLSERTRGLIGARELSLMKPTAWLVNTSRGPLVDEAALVTALREKTIAGAGLDVYDIEPLPTDHPLRSEPNAILSPHIGYVTEEGYRLYYPQMLEDVEAWLTGAPIRTIATNEVKDKKAAAPR